MDIRGISCGAVADQDFYGSAKYQDSELEISTRSEWHVGPAGDDHKNHCFFHRMQFGLSGHGKI